MTLLNLCGHLSLNEIAPKISNKNTTIMHKLRKFYCFFEPTPG
jgi:hypothetical protein